MMEREFSYDIIITNWLLMYMDDSECKEFIRKCLEWIKEDGFMFLRESCLYQSGNLLRSFNPTYYRSSEKYTQLFKQISTTLYYFKITKHNSIKCYQKIKHNSNQYYWLLQKVKK